MSLCAAAAYKTVTADFALDTLHAHFLAGPKTEPQVQLKITRISDSGRFAVRMVSLEQSGVRAVLVTCSFARVSKLGGASMTHSVRRKSKQTVRAITLDDLEEGKNAHGPYMKFQRLPLEYTGPEPEPESPSPQSMTYTSVATISPAISSAEAPIHALGIVALSDYHVLDAPPTLHGIPHGVFDIGDSTRTPRPQQFERYTSLNHTVRFRAHGGFRADELCYVEVNSPWTNSRRAEVQSRIFDSAGNLIASCVQEPFYVLNDRSKESRI